MDAIQSSEAVDWPAQVKGLLRSQMARRGITYRHLADRLAELGVLESEMNLRKRLSRGAMTAALFVQCLMAMDVRTLRLEDSEDLPSLETSRRRAFPADAIAERRL